jgi:hypothetical protein
MTSNVKEFMKHRTSVEGICIMKKTLNYFFTLTVIILVSSLFVCAQDAGEYAAEWLKIGVGARAIGMGESYAAVADDASGIFWNPAGLSGAKKTQLILQYGMWLANTGSHAVGFLQPIGKREESPDEIREPDKRKRQGRPRRRRRPRRRIRKIVELYEPMDDEPIESDWDEEEPHEPDEPVKPGVTNRAIGIGITYLDYGNIIRTTDLSSTEISESEADYFAANSYCAMVSYSQTLGESISVGVTAKMINEMIDEQTTIEATAGDVGLLFTPGGLLSIGAVVQNIGATQDNIKLPQNIKAGIKIGLETMIISADANQTEGREMKISAGLEFNLKDTMSLRCGYLMGIEDVGDGGILPRGITLGFGTRTESISLDLAFVGWGALGYESSPLQVPVRVSLLFEF